METKDDAIARVAADELRVPTLDGRGSDAMDFYDKAVWEIKAALSAAYDAGRASVKSKGESR